MSLCRKLFSLAIFSSQKVVSTKSCQGWCTACLGKRGFLYVAIRKEFSVEKNESFIFLAFILVAIALYASHSRRGLSKTNVGLRFTCQGRDGYEKPKGQWGRECLASCVVFKLSYRGLTGRFAIYDFGAVYSWFTIWRSFSRQMVEACTFSKPAF